MRAQLLANSNHLLEESNYLMMATGPGLPSDHRPTSPAVLHGDFHLDNTLFLEGAPALSGIIDWELTAVGEPLRDLGMSASGSFRYRYRAWYGRRFANEDPADAPKGL